MDEELSKSILLRARRAIAANRHPGLYFSGYFLGLHARGVDKEGAHVAAEYGLHSANADGAMNVGAIAVLADMGLASAMREHIAVERRMATATMQLQFTGVPVRSELSCDARFDGFFQGAEATLGRMSAVLKAADQVVCHASGTFATPYTPPGTVVHPLPWEQMDRAQSLPPMPVKDMRDDEKLVLKSVRAAARHAAAAGGERAFIEHFWSQLAKPREGGGADNVVKPGPHLGNRSGNMQGGVMFGIAASTAAAAVPANARLAGAQAWYISPGVGAKLRVRSRVLQQGRTMAVVRTEIIGDEKRLVMQMMTSHLF